MTNVSVKEFIETCAEHYKQHYFLHYLHLVCVHSHMKSAVFIARAQSAASAVSQQLIYLWPLDTTAVQLTHFSDSLTQVTLDDEYREERCFFFYSYSNTFLPLLLTCTQFWLPMIF